MANNAKKYILTALTLGAIAAASAGLIGVVNLLTRDEIKKNEEKTFNKGITAIFGDGSTSSTFHNGKALTYVVASYHVDNANGENIGWAVKTEGSNMYGKISMIAGFDYDTKSFKGIYLIKNEQTYASTLVDYYVDPLNGGARQLDDVSCGATYGATLVKDMIKDAQTFVDGIIYD